MKMLSVRYLLLFSFIFALCSFGEHAKLVDEVVAETNEYREANGMGALQAKAELNALAQKHSEAMASGRTAFGHDGFEQRHKQATSTIKSMVSFAENVAYGAETATQVVENWKKSAGHRKNMLGKSYRFIGVGVARSKKGQLYYTQLFGG